MNIAESLDHSESQAPPPQNSPEKITLPIIPSDSPKYEAPVPLKRASIEVSKKQTSRKVNTKDKRPLNSKVKCATSPTTKGGAQTGRKLKKQPKANLPPRDTKNKKAAGIATITEADEVRIAPFERHNSANLESTSLVAMNRILEESKEREERITKRLELLRERAKLAVDKCNTDDGQEEDEENKDLVDKLAQYENEMNSVKNTMDNILHVTKETHSEIQRTKDLVVNIQSDTSQVRLGGSFQSKFVEDDDVEMFKGSPQKSEFEHTNIKDHSQQSPIITTNDEDGLSIFIKKVKILEYVITSEDPIDDENDDDDTQNQVIGLRYFILIYQVKEKKSDFLKKKCYKQKASVSKKKKKI